MLSYKTLVYNLHYDALYGKFYWKKSYWTSKIGKEAGCIVPGGYIKIRLHGKTYSSHILAYLWNTYKYPYKGSHIHHKDGNTSNNILYNLEILDSIIHTSELNIRRNGMHYIYKNGISWQVKITENGKEQYLGAFKTIKEAKNVRDNYLQNSS